MQRITPTTIAQKYLRTWAACEDKDIEGCFQRFNPEGDEHQHSGQFERLYGINFGQAGADFYNFVKGMTSESSLAMSLGVDDKFKVMFETVQDTTQNEPVYYESAEEDGGLQFHSHETPQAEGKESIKKRYGILPVVRDHICVNWFGLLPSDIHEKFLAMEPTQNVENLTNQYKGKPISSSVIKELIALISDPFNRLAVRAMKYPIVGYNLEVLQKIIQPESNITVTFGLVPADFYYNDDLFTVILEVDNSNVGIENIAEDGDDGTTYLDFVHACPPWCDPD